MSPAPRPSGAPRWPVLLSLSGAVLAAHLWLLAGDLPLGASNRQAGTPAAPAAHGADPAAPTTTPGTEAGPAPFRVPAVTVSAVRWIPPAPAAAAPTASASTAARSAPTAERRAAAAPERPKLRDEIAIATPQPVEEEPADDPATAAPAAEPPPVAVAVAAPPPPAESPSAQPTAPPVAEAEPATEVAAAAMVAGRTAASPPPAHVPGSVELLYDISGQAKSLRYSADARLRWQVDGSRYEAELEISAFLVGSRVQTSRGRLGAAGLEPERFGDRRRSTEKAAHFDAASQRIRFSSNAPDAPLRPGAQDRLSVFLQLAGLLNARPEAYADGAHLSLQVAGTGSAEEWRFHIGPLQDVQLPAGQVSARKLTREPRHEHDSRIEIWLAPALKHLPVRIRVTEADGGQADQRLRQLPTLSAVQAPPMRLQ